MGTTVRLEGRELAWARDLFSEYYRSVEVPLPARFARREFAAFPFTTEAMMRRHAAFRSAEELRGFLARDPPRHVYYSSAYYRYPDHPTMPGKEWLGADVVFDLDADHLRGAESLDYAEQLALVRRRVKDLLDDFLFGDFGIDPARTRLVFSGGRGYHVHIQDEAFATLTSPERRELVDYVMGAGFDPQRAIASDRGGVGLAPLDGPEDGGPTRATRAFARLPPTDAAGWAGRTTRAVLAVLERYDAEGVEFATEDLARAGLSKAKARHLAKLLVTEGLGRKVRSTLSLEVRKGELPSEFFDAVVRRAALTVQGETDAPVTTDIHRLIRLPGSLHGGTGFRVAPVPLDALDRFDPFAEALPPERNGGTVGVRLTASVDHPFPATRVRGPSGEELELPPRVALFLLLRGEAALRASAE
jgi:DNA primase small subunit